MRYTGGAQRERQGASSVPSQGVPGIPREEELTGRLSLDGCLPPRSYRICEDTGRCQR